MLTLYFSKGSSALAAHILLEETGTAYKAHEVSIPKGDHMAADYLHLNPKGRVPALGTPDGIISENPAILEYIAATHSNPTFLPKGTFELATARSLCAYLCATTHVAFAHKQRGSRWANDAQTIEGMKEKVPANLSDSAAYLEQHVLQGDWALGPNYSYCDPYVFLMGRWMAMNDLALAPFPKLAAHHAAMLARPATQTVLTVHGLA